MQQKKSEPSKRPRRRAEKPVCSKSPGKKRSRGATTGSSNLDDILFRNVNEGILVTDPRGEVITLNPAFTTMTDREAAETIGASISTLFADKNNTSVLESIPRELKKQGRWEGELWIRHKNGNSHPLLTTAITKPSRGKSGGRVIYFFTDITEHIGSGSHARNHAYYDTLTGLPNRLLLTDRLSFMISRSKRNKSFLAMLLMDVNRFHTINDTLGFSTGDQLLQAIGTRLKSCIRDVDAVFRLGDDEFAMILEGISQPEDASVVARRILNSCATPFHLSNSEVFVTLSIGISTFPTDGDTAEELLKNSLAARTRAKDSGINHFRHYQPAMNENVLEQFTLENDLRRALENGELLVYFQPQINLVTREVDGAEALIRWMHPKLGMVSPAKFIPIAEANGLIVPIGEWVLKTACVQMKRWQEEYSRNLSVAVNLSNRQFQQQDLVAMVARALEESGLDGKSLELEITESMGMKNPEGTLKTLLELKGMGIKIAIDDFGTGYSSIYYLKRFPIDTIKIDRSFVDDIITDTNDATIVLAMIALAGSLKLAVIAEGVENRDQLRYLLDHGCQRIQGFIYSPPVNPHGFEKLLADPALLHTLVF